MTTCYGATQPVFSSAVQQYSLYNIAYRCRQQVSFQLANESTCIIVQGLDNTTAELPCEHHQVSCCFTPTSVPRKASFIYSFIYLHQATRPIRNKNIKNMNEKQTDRDRLTKPCNTKNTTSLKRENIC